MMKKERTAGRPIFFISIFKKGRSILAVGGGGAGRTYQCISRRSGWRTWP